VRLIDPAQHAGVILAIGRRHLEVVAATSPVPQQLDELQQREGAGRASTPHGPSRSSGSRTWARTRAGRRSRSRATVAGVRSMLCLPLHVDTSLFGTLSVYADTPRAFKDVTESVARVLAVLAAITLSSRAGARTWSGRWRAGT
jgi:transcriptional regulator with GAF, ATPase, and Fis domain